MFVHCDGSVFENAKPKGGDLTRLFVRVNRKWLFSRLVGPLLVCILFCWQTAVAEDADLRSATLQRTASSSDANVLKIATGEWVPYVSESYLGHGAIAQIITRIFSTHGIRVQYRYLPWPRGYQMVLDGEFHATMPYYCSPEREKLYFCSDPIMDGKQVFFHRKDFDFDWKQLRDLEGLNIGATLGYYYGEMFEQYEADGFFKVHRVARDESNFFVLIKGRTHVFPQDLQVGYSMIRKLFPPEDAALLTHHPKPLHSNPLHLIFPRNNPNSERWLQWFNEGLQQLKDSGELTAQLEALRRGDYE
ncbi:substrate-binding periplasmic protein [Oleiphilus messinensis]|uniref:substrate-binding periplasmic protein n=1 Tax=Oleiphilus messinensis TaxID=141451 RepID=UPI000B3B95E0|nr:transporter substrate-binding domain-containing protein [Oleiphilus messinensis]